MKIRRHARAKKFRDWLRRLRDRESMPRKFDADCARMQSPEFAKVVTATRARLGEAGFRRFGEKRSAQSLEDALTAVSERRRSEG